MNCSVTPLARLVGTGVLPGPQTEAAKQDRALFMQILQAHQLCILNSWSRPTATYQHPKGRSQIDFIATRVPLADGWAKTCRPYESLLAGWRSAGHKPLVASLRPSWKPWALSRSVKDDAIRAAQDSLGYAEGLLKPLHVALQSSSARPDPRPSMPQRANVDQHIHGFWQLRRRVSKLRWRDARGILLAWHLSARLKAAKRDVDRRLRQAKRARILAVLQQAEDAAAQKLAGGFYRFVKLLSPKTNAQRIRLRDDQGGLVDQRGECKILANYAASLFKGQAWTLPQLLPVPTELFSAARWLEAFRVIPRNKAVPVFTPPLASWKDQAKELSSALEGVVARSIGAESPVIPVEWVSVQIAWLPKPNKCPSCPSNLRTIGLMSGDQKALLHIIKEHIRAPIMSALLHTPQYAYRAGVSTHDAILRSSGHCAQMRRQLESLKTDLTSKLSGRHRTELVGGLMANLDLAKAFDTLPYSEIYQSLCDAGVDDILCRLIVHLHASTQCVILHGSSCEVVAMSRGLRQGCPIAPYIFAAWSVRVCKCIDAVLGSGWSQSHLTLFSDDTHCFWSINNVAELDVAVGQLTTIIQTLTRLGMRINFSKSSAVCALKGLGSHRAQRRHFCWRDGMLCLRLRQEPADLHIPLGETLEYLGVILSYHHFELQSAMFRASKADANFARLHKVLRTNGPLSDRQRQRVYTACVHSCLVYGLAGVGFTKASYRVIQSKLCQHLCKVLRVYQEGVTNHSVLQRAGIAPQDDLRKRAAAQLRAIESDTGRSPSLKHHELKRAQEVIESLDVAIECSSGTPTTSLVRLCASATAIAECSVCGQSFAGSHNLVMHINSKHPEINQTAKVAFKRHLHALHGVPRCRFCRVVHHSWQVLEQHITCGMCPVIKAGVGRGFNIEAIFQSVVENELIDPPIPPVGISSSSALLFYGPEHRQCLPSVIKQVPTVRQYTTACALCGQRLQDASRIKDHWRKTHALAWQLAEVEARSHARSLCATFSVPCQYCSSTAKDPKAHSAQCPAMFQLLAVRILHRKRCTLGELQKEAGSHTAAAAAPTTRLANPHTQCYINASILALGHALHVLPIPSALDDVLRICQEHGSASHSLHIAAQAELVALTPTWFFGIRQQDAAEYLTLLLQFLMHEAWQSRLQHEGVQVRDRGLLITLDLSRSGSNLQQSIQDWHVQHFTHALSASPPVLCIQLGRYPGYRKLAHPINIPQALDIPSFVSADSLSVTWVRYSVTSIIVHLGVMLTEAEEFASFDFLASYAPNGARQAKDAEIPNEIVNSSASPIKGPIVAISVAQLRNEVQMLQKIVLRHEDALGLMRQEVAFIIHFRIGVDASLVNDIYKSQLGWRELRKNQPAKITTTLRNTLMECVFKVLLHRIQKLEDPDQQAVRDRLTKAGWLDSRPQPHSEVKAALTSLLEGVKKPDSVTKFHPLRPVTNSMSGESVAFALQYPFRGELARSLYEATVQLSNSSATQMIAAQIRVDREQRSGLANAIARQS
ncbi:Pol [Symbiodinium sp. CCMP2592]|nr:Pol [Symbiodinium sp. CCMP2592]